MVLYERMMEAWGCRRNSLLNEDVGNETMADITLSAMIDEGDDCDDFVREKNESEFI